MVTIIASDAALIEIDQAKVGLNITGDDQDDLLQDLINRASEYCEAWCNRKLKARPLTDLRLAPPWGCTLRPPAVPIVTTAEVDLSVDGITQSVWRREADGDPATHDVIVVGDASDPRSHPSLFHRGIGWGSASATNPRPILLSYTGGFLDTPGELVDAALLIVQSLHRAQFKQATDLVGYTSQVGGSVTYAPEVAGSLIPMKAKQILDEYRWVPI
jgi:hypothetical protein